ncbi:IS1380 family transposase, partial [Thiolapillus sp.]|uniref:IS1380 family transposase n=1 Tax=Thiolapillus sp. TaxID=2017437 RepID=UPI003AF86CE0
MDELQRIVGQIRARWPKTRIIIRADSGFCRDAIMAWCEANDVGYVLGLARNKRLQQALGKEMEEARLACERTGEAARCFRDFRYRTRKSWSCERRVIGKAEYLPGKANPRFVVTNLSTRDADAQYLYEDLYCARGEMENRIKEQQLGLFADRTSSATLRANQLRLYFSSFAYVLLHGLRRLGLTGTAFAKAQSTTIRLKLLKIGARLRLTARKVWLSFSEA